MLLAELELFHSRPVAPTRRVALGERTLPVEPAPGHGGLLLAAIVGTYIGSMDDDLVDEFDRLAWDLERRARVPQPRLRHRLQVDKVGLTRSRFGLYGTSNRARLAIDDARGGPAQHVLAAVYAAAELPPRGRTEVFALIRKGALWRGGHDDRLVDFLTDNTSDALLASLNGADPQDWALDLMGFPTNNGSPSTSQVRRRFRELLREAHPDHGGEVEGAAERIAQLAEARRILLG